MMNLRTAMPGLFCRVDTRPNLRHNERRKDARQLLMDAILDNDPMVLDFVERALRELPLYMRVGE